MKFHIAGLLLLPLLASAQGNKPIIDNDRVTVWDVTWEKNQPGFAAAVDHDNVTVYLSGGDFKTKASDGTSRTVKHKTGDAVFRFKGVRRSETWTGTGTPPRTTEIALKDSEKRPAVNTSGNPLAFPRPGTANLIDNERVFVWDSRWQPGVPTAMHFHDKDVVVLQCLGRQGRVARELREVDAALGLQPRSVLGHEGDRRHGRVADGGRQIDEIVEHLLGRGIENPIAEERLEASRFAAGVVGHSCHTCLSVQQRPVLTD